MNKIYILLLLMQLFLSCNVPKYTLTDNSQVYGVDFSIGKWLLNEIETSSDVDEKLTQLAKKDFGELVNYRLAEKSQIKGILIPKQIPLQPSKIALDDLKKGTNFDFFINIKAKKIKEDFGSIDYSPRNTSQARQNRSEVIIEIYNLNTLEIIYSQKAIGFTAMTENINDVTFSKSSRELQLGAYKKIIRDLKRKSIK